MLVARPTVSLTKQFATHHVWARYRKAQDGQIQIARSLGNSSHNGMVISVRRPLHRGALFQASYTLGKSLDYNSSYFGSGNLPGEPGAPVDARNLRLEHGPSAFDIRQRFVAFFYSGYSVTFEIGSPCARRLAHLRHPHPSDRLPVHRHKRWTRFLRF